MENFKIKVKFLKTEEAITKSGKAYTKIKTILDDEKPIIFSDYDNNFTVILAENNVKQYDHITLVYKVSIDKFCCPILKPLNIEV